MTVCQEHMTKAPPAVKPAFYFPTMGCLQILARSLRLDVDHREVSPVDGKDVKALAEHDPIPRPTETWLQEAAHQPAAEGALATLTGKRPQAVEASVASENIT